MCMFDDTAWLGELVSQTRLYITVATRAEVRSLEMDRFLNGWTPKTSCRDQYMLQNDLGV